MNELIADGWEVRLVTLSQLFRSNLAESERRTFLPLRQSRSRDLIDEFSETL